MRVSQRKRSTKLTQWPVRPDQKTIHRVFGFRRDLAADEQQHQHRHERDAEKRGEEHREGLGEGERLEQSAFLRLEREDRNEAHRDDEQREKERAADLLAAAMITSARSRVVRLAAVLLAEMLERLVRVLDHDDGRIDHRADRDRDAAERHDVAKSGPVHNIGMNERMIAIGQRDDRDERGADVPEENDADQRDDDAFLDQLFAQRRDGALDQLAAIVGRDDLARPRAATILISVEFLFDAVDDVERVLAVAHDDDAADDFAFAVQFRDAAPDVGAEMDRADILHVNRRAVLDLERQCSRCPRRF